MRIEKKRLNDAYQKKASNEFGKTIEKYGAPKNFSVVKILKKADRITHSYKITPV